MILQAQLIPVSYTHLDVYKRQKYDLPHENKTKNKFAKNHAIAISKMVFKIFIFFARIFYPKIWYIN